MLRPVPAEETPTEPDRLVGREEEVEVLRRALTAGTGLVLVEGEPGAGKTQLLEEAAAEAGRRGALVVWARCLTGEGAPSMWPWVQAADALLDGLPDAAREQWEAGELGRLLGPGRGLTDSKARFHSQGVRLDRNGRMAHRVAGQGDSHADELARRLRIRGEESTDPIARAYGLYA